MKSGTKNTLIFALCVICLGLILVLAALLAGADMHSALEEIEPYFDASSENRYREEDFSNSMEAVKNELVPIGNVIPASQIRNLKLEIAAAEAVVVPGRDFSVRASDNICAVRQEGDTLKISSRRRGLGLFKVFGKAQQIEITVPANFSFGFLDIELGAGSLVCSSELKCGGGKAEIGMGNCRIQNLRSTGDFDVECGMGAVHIEGRIDGNSRIECGMGEVSMVLDGRPEDYAYKAEVGMGSIKINDTEISGVGGKAQSPYSAAKNLNVECGMGSVGIKIGM